MRADAAPLRVTIVYPNLDAAIDGIRDHSLQLAGALCRAGKQARVAACIGRAAGGEVILLQYNPFAYGRWGFAPWLPLSLGRLRLRRGRPWVMVLVHEPYLPLEGWRWTLLGLWQRAQLRAVKVCADGLYSSTEGWTARLEGALRRPVGHLPVGSNLPDASAKRTVTRDQLHLREQEVVIASFGTGHDDRLTGHLAAAVAAIAECLPITFLNLGARAPMIQFEATRVRVIAPGAEPAERIAARLAAADLYLCPWRDGVSTKRGSLMAALQHGLPVVGTAGENTDPLLHAAAGEALWLVPAADRDEFAAAALALARDKPRRAAMREAARSLYRRRFSWEVTAKRLIRDLDRDVGGHR